MAYDSSISLRPPACFIDLKGRADAMRALASRALGLALPERPNTWSEAEGVSIAWIGEEHWLLMAGLAWEETLAEKLRSPDISSVIVSDAHAGFNVAGPDAAEVMAQATPLDLHPDAFPENGAAYTELFGLKALVARRDGAFHCWVDSSYRDFVADCLSRCHAATVWLGGVLEPTTAPGAAE